MTHSTLKNNRGFTLLEVIITITLLSTIVLTVSQLLRYSIDMRQSLSTKDKATQKLNRILTKLSSDLSHAFIISTKNLGRVKVNKNRTLFEIIKSEKGDSLRMTYMGHQAKTANSKEADTSFVVYELRESKKNPNQKNLYRGEFPRIPESFKENPTMTLFANNVQSFHLEAWNGDDWMKEGWDSTKGDTKNKLPYLIRIVVKVLLEENVERESSRPVVEYSSVIVYMPNALNYNELKDRTSSLLFKI